MTTSNLEVRSENGGGRLVARGSALLLVLAAG